MKKIVAAIMAIITTLSVGLAMASPVMAENAATKDACSGDLDETQKAALGCDQDKTAPKVGETLINAVISIVGIVAILMIIVGGQRYITSQGDPGQMTQAKNMIIYSVVGLVIAMLAFAIVNFVLGNIFSSPTT